MWVDALTSIARLISSWIRLPNVSTQRTDHSVTRLNSELTLRIETWRVEFKQIVAHNIFSDIGIVKVSLQVNRTTTLPATDEACSKLVSERAQLVRGLHEETIPVLHVLLQLPEAEETAVEHPDGASAGIGISWASTQNDTLRDDILAWRHEFLLLSQVWKVAHHRLGYAIHVAKVLSAVLSSWSDLTINLEREAHGVAEQSSDAVEFLFYEPSAVASNEQDTINLLVEPVGLPVWSLSVRTLLDRIL